MKKTKVFIFQPYIAPYRIGLFNALANYPDIDLYIVQYSDLEKRRSGMVNDCAGKEVEYKTIRLNSRIKPIDFEHNATRPNCRELLTLLFKYRPDVVVTASNQFGQLLSILKPLYTYKIIDWSEKTRITRFNKGAGRRAKFFYYPRVDAFWGPGEATRQYYEFAGINKNQSRVFYEVPNTVDAKFNLSAADINKKFTSIDMLEIIFSGSLIERKGFDLLKKAIVIVNKNKYERFFQITCLGNGENKVEIENMIYPGFLTGSEYLGYIQRSQVFVLPSRWDCNPLTVIEAAKSGHIMLLSDGVGNYPEFCQENGIVFKRGDLTSLVNALDWVLRQPVDMLRTMALKSVELSKKISHENSAATMQEAIYQVVTNKQEK